MKAQNLKQTEQEELRKKRKKRLLILLLLLLLAGGCYSLYHVLGQKPKENVTIISGTSFLRGRMLRKCLIRSLRNLPSKRRIIVSLI